MRAASVLEIEANDLWSQLMPMQVVGFVLAIALAGVAVAVAGKRGDRK